MDGWCLRIWLPSTRGGLFVFADLSPQSAQHYVISPPFRSSGLSGKKSCTINNKTCIINTLYSRIFLFFFVFLFSFLFDIKWEQIIHSSGSSSSSYSTVTMNFWIPQVRELNKLLHTNPPTPSPSSYPSTQQPVITEGRRKKKKDQLLLVCFPRPV